MTAIQEISSNDGARVLLVSTNRERQPYPVVPNGLACVASALDAAGHKVRFLDLCFARDPLAVARDAARSFKPDIVASRFETSTTAMRSRCATTRRRRGTSC